MASTVQQALLRGLLDKGPGGSVLKSISAARKDEGQRLQNVAAEQKIGAFDEQQERDQRRQDLEVAKFTADRLSKQTEADQKDAVRVAKILNSGITPQQAFDNKLIDEEDFLSFEGDSPEQIALKSRGVLAGSAFLTADEQGFNALIQGFSEEDQIKARQVKAGLAPRAVAAAPRFIADVGAVVDPTTATGERVTVAGEVQTPDVIAATKAQEEEARKFGAATGADRAKTIKDSFSQLQNIERNNRNIDRAVEAIDSGAATGFVQSFFPNIRASSIRLNNVVNELGLDVIGSVTFGALSKGELDLALATAIPTTLEPSELREWLLNKKEAQTKMISYLDNQIQFIEGGGSVAEFRRQQQSDLGDVESMTNDEILARLRGG